MSKISHMIATLGPVGTSLPAPGTWGSLVALLTGAYILSLGWTYLAVACLISIIVGYWAAHHYHLDTGKKDASEVVIDEVAGQWSVLLVTPLSVEGLICAFILFRFFDILKPFPINKADQLEGATGVMADDIVAGGIAGMVMLFLIAVGVVAV